VSQVVDPDPSVLPSVTPTTSAPLIAVRGTAVIM
jgi:hypothetical protein